MNQPYNFSIPITTINVEKCLATVSISVKEESNYGGNGTDHSDKATYTLNANNITVNIDMGPYYDYRLDVHVSYSIVEFY